jgi:hypothetical protein
VRSLARIVRTPRRNPKARWRKALLAPLPALMVAPMVGGLAAGVPSAVRHPAECTTHTVSPQSTATDIANAIKAAHSELTHPSWAVGPTGALQGVVYFQKGAYTLTPITFTRAQSNVRLVFDPGVKIRPAAGTSQDLFTLGTAASQTSNVSFVAGDGCGTVNYPPSDLRYVWANTNQRGNQAGIYRQTSDGYVAGMPNIDLGGQSGWPRSHLASMWVLDLDPAGVIATASDDFDPGVAGFQVTNADGVRIADFVAYQNAARLVNADGTPRSLGDNGARVPGATSATTVVMIQPDWSAYATTDPSYPAPTNVTVSDVYDVLAPSGWGPEQVRVCQGCTFDTIFSHGGTALRLETDGGGKTTPRGCDGLGVSATASNITGMYGNNVAAFTPHCRTNGVVQVSGLRGFSNFNLAAFGAPEQAGAGFTSVTVDTINGCGSGSAATAQKPRPDINSYELQPSNDAVTDAPAYAVGAGTYRWPDPSFGDQGALPTDVLPGATYQRGSAACQ